MAQAAQQRMHGTCCQARPCIADALAACLPACLPAAGCR
jgi:hypothetical protein